MGIKDIFLKQGWAGKTIGREETIERLNPILRTANELMQRLGAFAAESSDQDVKTRIEASLRIHRMDIGKLCETVFSCGGVAYSGTDLSLNENTLSDMLAAESKIEHQMRTRAILGVLQENQRARQNSLRNLG
jgi:ElaB/YqjD/DUF883 family membrane-anchored ribosome-binding protein